MARHDSAGSTHYDNGRLSRAFRTLRDVDVIVEVNLSEDPDAQPTSWEDTELGPREASEYRAAAARLNYLSKDRPDILFASKECSRRVSSPRNGDWTALKRVVRYLLGKPRLVWRYVWRRSPNFSVRAVTPIGLDVTILARVHLGRALCTGHTLSRRTVAPRAILH